jgi:membrane protein
VVQLKDALNVVWEVGESKESGLWHFARNYMLSFAAVLTLGFERTVSVHENLLALAANVFKLRHKSLEIARGQGEQKPIAGPF